MLSWTNGLLNYNLFFFGFIEMFDAAANAWNWHCERHGRKRAIFNEAHNSSLWDRMIGFNLSINPISFFLINLKQALSVLFIFTIGTHEVSILDCFVLLALLVHYFRVELLPSLFQPSHRGDAFCSPFARVNLFPIKSFSVVLGKLHVLTFAVIFAVRFAHTNQTFFDY